MRALILLCLVLLISSAATAKEVQLSVLWSGNWVAEEDGHRCSVRIGAAPQIGPATITLLCALGSNGVSAQSTLDPANFQIPLRSLGAEFGTPASGARVWGSATVFPFCNPLPVLHVSIERFSPPLAELVNFRAESLDYTSAAKLCGGDQ